MDIQSFKVQVADDQLADLKERLARTRLPGDLANETWHYGTNQEYLQQLLTEWRDAYDWRKHEAAMNRYEQYRATIDGQPIHFLHVKRGGTKALLLLGGWPWTFWDFEEVIPALSEDFDLVVPSLPGHGFSPLMKPKLGFLASADLFQQLMSGLGYSRYGVYGADWGSLIAEQMAYKYAENVIGLHTSMPFPLDFAPIPQELWGAEEGEYAQLTAAWWQYGTAYFQMHSSKPQTVAYLGDSPAALAAWIVEKLHDWSDDNGAAYPREKMLTTLSLYWFTNTLGSSARFYAESMQNPWQGKSDTQPVINVPTGVAAFPKEVAQVPRKWVEQYFNLKRYTRMDRGGHFPAAENPTGLAREINAFFQSL